MKKIVSFVLCLAMVLNLGLTYVYADNAQTVYTSGGYKYALLEDGTIKIQDYSGIETDLIIPREIDGYAVSAIGDCAFMYNSSVVSVVIPEGVTSIGEYAFAYSSVTDLSIPETVTSIKYAAFMDCALESIQLPSGIDSITESMFAFSRHLHSIVIPDNVTRIETEAFYCCNNLQSVVLPDGVTYIGDRAFSDCDLESIDIPTGVITIGDSAFENATNLYEEWSIVIPDSVTTIGARAFAGLGYLKNINIPDSVTSVGEGIFWRCSRIRNIEISANHPALEMVDNVLFAKEGKKLLYYMMGTKRTEYMVPQGTLAIGDGAFNYCWTLNSITIPDSVTSIGENAFYCCSDLKSINIPDSVSSFDNLAFYECKKLTDIQVSPNHTLLEIADGALCNKKEKRLIFYSPTNEATTYDVPEGILSIGDYAFSDCENLVSVTIPEGVEYIGEYAFWHCNKLQSITLPSSLIEMDAPFLGCSRLKEIIVPHDSYAEEYCREFDYPYVFADAYDWLQE